jgi:hypothetical protein
MPHHAEKLILIEEFGLYAGPPRLAIATAVAHLSRA